MDGMRGLSDRIGQLFIAGFPGETPPEPFLEFIQRVQIGGILLLEENCPTHVQVRQNIERLNGAMSSVPLFIAVDQEGGRVCRLRGAPAELRPAFEYGELNDTTRFREDYARAAVYMESLGINMNLAPVADIALDARNTCLKGRCFGSEAEEVAEFVRASVEVSKSASILCCLKHFPGLGAAIDDPHLRTAAANYDSIVWQQREKIPFEAGLKAGADLLMTTHMFVPGFDDKMVTVSDKIITELARGQLEFDGPIITDDLTMEGAATLGPYGERAVAAFEAGHDLLLFGRDYEAAMQAYEYFEKACCRNEVTALRIETALDRVAGLKFKLGRSVVS